MINPANIDSSSFDVKATVLPLDKRVSATLKAAVNGVSGNRQLSDYNCRLLFVTDEKASICKEMRSA